MPQNSSIILDDLIPPEKLQITSVSSDFYRKFNVRISIARLDRLHPKISGNKWFKLKPHLEYLISLGPKAPLIVSFGGAHSNHLHALAYAGHTLGLKTLGVIRGEKPEQPGPTLQDLEAWGMELLFISRQAYRNKTDHAFLAELRLRYGEDIYILPEGGASDLSRQACSAIVEQIQVLCPDVDYLACPTGTGNTFAGLVKGALPYGLGCIGFCALRNTDEVHAALAKAQISESSYTLVSDAAGRGYAKVHTELAAFLAFIEQKHNLVLDPVYTGKMLLAFNHMLVAGHFPAGVHIVLLHTGGLQGIRGMQSELERRRTRFVGPLLC